MVQWFKVRIRLGNSYFTFSRLNVKLTCND